MVWPLGKKKKNHSIQLHVLQTKATPAQATPFSVKSLPHAQSPAASGTGQTLLAVAGLHPAFEIVCSRLLHPSTPDFPGLCFYVLCLCCLTDRTACRTGAAQDMLTCASISSGFVPRCGGTLLRTPHVGNCGYLLLEQPRPGSRR
jgi:hypothetical protein